MNIFEYVEGATPIEDASALMPTHLINQKQLDDWESANILKAINKYLSRKAARTFDINLIKDVHREMFDETWQWAGQFRQSNLNFGVEKHRILEEIKKLIDDIQYWQENNSFNLLQQSVRIHHRLVWIHPFLNGNGRHARLIADILLYSHDHPLPDWPDAGKIKTSNIRHEYLEALKSADKGDYKLLEDFTKKLMK